MYTVGQFARILNVSAKTLRHYDEIGLFSPAVVGADNRYRYYRREQILPARRILFFRDLGLTLEIIRELIRSGAVDEPERVAAILQEHAGGVRQEIMQREALLVRLEKTIARIGREGEVPEMTERAVSVKEVPAVGVVGVRRTVPIRGIGALFDEAMAKVRGPVAAPPVAIYYDPEFDPERADVEVVFPVATGSERMLPAARVASLTHIGPYDNLGESYAALFGWVNQQGLKVAGPVREVYLVGPESGKAPQEYVTEIQVPIG